MRRKSSWHLGTPMPVALWIVVPFTCVAAMPVGAQTATFCEYLCGHQSVSRFVPKFDFHTGED